MKNTCTLQIALIILLSAAILPFLPTTPNWRDSGEFLLGAAYLDILHPAGFPTYGQLANLFSLIPFGPLIWRIHLFAGVVTIFWLLSLYCIAKEILLAQSSEKKCHLNLLAILAPCCALVTAPCMKGALSAEAYSLNALFCSGLIFLFLNYRRTKDARLLPVAAFVSGVAAGNHIVFAFICIASLPAWICLSIPWKRIFLPCLISLVMGLGVYGYLPVRSSPSLPLNTGEPTSIARFINQISDARDRALRPKEPEIIQTQSSYLNLQIISDTKRVLNLFSVPGALFLCIGIIALIKRDRSLALLFAGISIATLVFFTGWDPDPWLPVIGIFSILVSLGVYSLSELLRRTISKEYVPAATLVIMVLIILSLPWQENFKTAKLFRDFSTPTSVIEDKLAKIPYRGVMLIEPSWFLVKSSALLSGLRDDITFVYEPSLLFPSYFSSVHLIGPDNKTFNSTDIISESYYESTAPMVRNIGRLLILSGSENFISFEPTQIISELLKSVVTLRDDGAIGVVKNQLSTEGSSFIKTRSDFFAKNRLTSSDLPNLLKGDTLNYLETIAANETSLLQSIGKNDLSFLRSLCDPPHTPCSSKTVLSLAATLYSSNDPCGAKELLADLGKRSSKYIEGVFKLALQSAESGCSSLRKAQ